MDITEIFSEIERGELRTAYLFLGGERFLIDRAVASIRRKCSEGGISGFNEDMFDGAQGNVDRILNAARTQPMMADRRFVFVRNTDSFKADALEGLANYIADPSPSTCLVLLAEKLDGRSKLMKAAKDKKFLIQSDALKGPMLDRFVASEARRKQIVLSPQAQSAVMDAIGTDLSAMEDALERLSLYVGSGGKRIEVSDVEACVTRIRVESIFKLVDAVAARKLKVALECTGQLLADREPPLRILAMVSRQLKIVARFRDAMDRGETAEEAVKTAGAPPFKARELAQISKVYTPRAIERAMLLVAEADLRMKGSKVPGDLILEDTIVRLCA